MEYVRSEHAQLASTAPSSIRHAPLRIRSNSNGVSEETDHFFNLVLEGDVALVRKRLEKAQIEKSSFKSQLCHPLCDCKKCIALLDK